MGFPRISGKRTFGHEKGSFTGARATQGLIENAADGTLFLDEIGELRRRFRSSSFVSSGTTFQRVGGRQEIQIDTRVIAATNADLKQTISEGKFREDLYFRLAVVVIMLPPLRDRGDDVALLAREFLQRYAAQNNKKSLAFSPDALRALYKHNWPGNVRELQTGEARGHYDRWKTSYADDLELAELYEMSPAN
jgi:two-component system NtrC family response regulator